MRPAHPLLDIRGLRKSYGAAEVLKGIDLAVSPGELVFLIGPSGSGKSTLLRCCNRLEEASGGSIWFDGQEVLADRIDINALRRRMGMVFQSFNLYPHMSALGNVTLALRKVLKKPRAEAERIGMAALERVGLAHKAASYPGELSGGQQQRVAIARAIVTEPELLLADEPTGNLDSERSREIMELLVDLNRNHGITVMMVTHEPDMAEFARRQIRFKDGRIVSDEVKS